MPRKKPTQLLASEVDKSDSKIIIPKMELAYILNDDEKCALSEHEDKQISAEKTKLLMNFGKGVTITMFTVLAFASLYMPFDLPLGVIMFGDKLSLGFDLPIALQSILRKLVDVQLYTLPTTNIGHDDPGKGKHLPVRQQEYFWKLVELGLRLRGIKLNNWDWKCVTDAMHRRFHGDDDYVRRGWNNMHSYRTKKPKYKEIMKGLGI